MTKNAKSVTVTVLAIAGATASPLRCGASVSKISTPPPPSMP